MLVPSICSTAGGDITNAEGRQAIEAAVVLVKAEAKVLPTGPANGEAEEGADPFDLDERKRRWPVGESSRLVGAKDGAGCLGPPPWPAPIAAIRADVKALRRQRMACVTLAARRLWHRIRTAFI